MKHKRPSRDQLLKLAREDPEAIVDLVLELMDRVEKLEQELAELKRNSRNSSKPPSSDKTNPSNPKKRPKKRAGGRKRPGGQPGHPGQTLHQVSNPDWRILHRMPNRCGNCGAGVSRSNVEGHESRQVFDLPEEITMEVTEHLAEIGTCPCCGKKLKGEFPEEVKAPVQYGDRIKALVIYLQTYQLLPCERLSELCADLFNCPMSPGTVAGFLQKAGKCAKPITERIKQRIRAAPFMHNDETGLSLGGKTHWLHTASTPSYAYFHIDEKRGFQALEQMGMLEGYEGFSIHDFYSSYYKIKGLSHGLCNAHHLRDLTFIHEELGQPWAKRMIELLLDAKERKDRERNGGPAVSGRTLGRLQNRYFEILEDGFKHNPEPRRKKRKRGRVKRGKALNMLRRLLHHSDEVLAFVYFDLPFDNNEAERDLRMMKTKQKISGCFRSRPHADAFTGIRSIITSAKKQAINVLDIIQATISDQASAEEMLFGS